MRRRVAMVFLTLLAVTMWTTPAMAGWLATEKPAGESSWIAKLGNPVVGSWTLGDALVEFRADGEMTIKFEPDEVQRAHYWFTDNTLVAFPGSDEGIFEGLEIYQYAFQDADLMLLSSYDQLNEDGTPATSPYDVAPFQRVPGSELPPEEGEIPQHIADESVIGEWSASIEGFYDIHLSLSADAIAVLDRGDGEPPQTLRYILDSGRLVMYDLATLETHAFLFETEEAELTLQGIKLEGDEDTWDDELPPPVSFVRSM